MENPTPHSPRGEAFSPPVRRKDWLQRLSYIFLPFVGVSLATTILLSLIYAFPVLSWNWIRLPHAVSVIWLPLIAAAIIALGFLQPRIRRASFGKEQMKFIFLNVLAVVILWMPMVQSQHVVEEFFSTLEVLPSAKMEGKVPYARQYDFESATAIVEARTLTPIRVPGRDMDRIVMVVLTPLGDSLSPAPVPSSIFWVYQEYELEVARNIDSASLAAKYNPWVNTILSVLEGQDAAGGLWYSRIEDGQQKGLADRAMELNGHTSSDPVAIIVVPHFEAWQPERAFNLFAWLVFYGISLVIWLVVTLILRLKAEPESKSQEISFWTGALAILLPRKGYTITPIVIILNLIFYLICAIASRNPIQFDGDVLIALGGNKRSLTQDAGEYWRLLTSAFIHGGLMHFMANMYGMFMMGRMLEPLLRAPRFLVSYLVTALAGSIVSLLLLPGDSVRIGASGALFGLMGMLLALGLTKLFPPQIRKPVLRTMFITLGLNLLTSFLPMIDYAAHLGGLASGLMLGFLWYPYLKRTKEAVLNARQRGGD